MIATVEWEVCHSKLLPKRTKCVLPRDELALAKGGRSSIVAPKWLETLEPEHRYINNYKYIYMCVYIYIYDAVTRIHEIQANSVGDLWVNLG